MSEFVNRVITDELSTIEALDYCVAVGSYGSEEYARVSGDELPVKLYNDLDLLIVTDRKAELADRLAIARRKISARLNLKWVDFLVWNNKELRRTRHTIFYYDLCRRHRVLIGDNGLFLSKLDLFEQSKISMPDIKALFRTRAWAVLSLFTSNDIYNNDRILKNYQCAKAIFAIADFLTLTNGNYQTHYKDKRQAVRQLPDTLESSFVKGVITQAYEVKINPESSALDCVVNSSEMLAKLCVCYVRSSEILLKRNLLAGFSNYVVHKYLSYVAALLRSLLARSSEPFAVFHNRVRIESELINLTNNPVGLQTDDRFIGLVDKLIARKM